MRFIFAVILSSMFVTLMAGCPLPDPHPPTPSADGGDELDASRTSCASACENLHRLGCPIANCEQSCAKAQGSLTDLHPACLSRADSKEAARACGSVRCP